MEQRDYEVFIELLMESVEVWNVRIATYCLMPSHYHLLIQTPDANLSRCMRHINGVYTQRFNRFHECDGQLFRGRYRSILVDADSYLLQLVRYIHRNPLCAGMVENLDSYDWSGHKGYVSRARKWNWLHKEFVLTLLSADRREQVRMYKEFVTQEDSEEIGKVYEQKKVPSILGSEGFVDWIKSRFFEQKKHTEVPESRALAPGKEKIRQVVCQFYQVREQNLLKSRRGSPNEPRNVAIYLARQLGGESLAEICREYGLKKHSSASSAVERVRNQISKDQQLSRRVEEIRQIFIKSQTET